VVVIDTHVLLHDALDPGRVSAKARRALEEHEGELAASDISLWEMAMLIAKGRVKPGADAGLFIERILEARRIAVLPVTPRIAVLSQSDLFEHRDPADRIIAATALEHRAPLVTGDAELRGVKGLKTIW
jgi:PIN domain nuclease of toxin-antitoxin system